MSYCVSSWLNFEGLKYVSAQLERLILYIYPTMVAALSFFFLKDKLTRRHIVALVLAYAGVAILFGAEIDHAFDHHRERCGKALCHRGVLRHVFSRK